MMQKSVPVTLLILAAQMTVALAQAPSADDFVRQSRICEIAARLPSGDVDIMKWSDCVEFRRIIPKEEVYAASWPNTPWRIGFWKSRLKQIDEGCVAFATHNKDRQLPNPKEDGEARRDLSPINHTWNVCMQREGAFQKTEPR